MRIVLDVDDCVLDWTKGFHKWLAESDILPDSRDALLTTSGRPWDVLGISLQECAEYITHFNTSDSFARIPYLPGAYDFIRDLGSAHEIVFLSACGRSDRTYHLRHKNLEPFSLTHTLICIDFTESKKDWVEQVCADLFVDDNIKHLDGMGEEWSDKCVLVRGYHNKNTVNDQYKQVTGLKELSAFIKNAE